MKIRSINLMGIILLLCLVLQACGTTPAVPTVRLPQATDTQVVPTVAAATDTPTQPPAPTPTPTPIPTSIPTPTQIQHVTKPGEPNYFVDQTITDCTLGSTTGSNPSVVIPPACDNPVVGYIERPVTADTKDYLPYLDIGQAQFGANRDWIFARVAIYDAVAQKGAGDLYYFFKLDLNFDGRNSNVIIISVKNLPLNAVIWTVNGVQAWKDVEGTISSIFDQGVGADPDLVWARRSPKTIELAFKPSLLNGPSRFAWWAWAYQGTLTPTDLGLAPIPADLYQIDNTCALGYNGSSANMVNNCLQR